MMREHSIRLSIDVYGMVMCLCFAMCLASCTEDQSQPGGTSAQGRPQAVETADPMGVVKAFCTSITKRDFAGALQQVLPAQRSAFEKELEKGFPPFPTTFELKLVSVSEKDRAQVEMVGQQWGLDLKWEDGRWWIIK